jgi:hypothetical protein
MFATGPNTGQLSNIEHDDDDEDGFILSLEENTIAYIYVMALALAVQAISLRQNAAIPSQHPKQSHTNLHSSSRVEHALEMNPD